MLKHEFEKFIKSLDGESSNISNYEKKIIKIIYNNFDEVVERKNRGSENRGQYIASLILQDFSNENYDLPEIGSIEVNDETNEDNIIISKAQFAYFRGFSDIEEFVFNEKFNLIYGYNGTGKSSFSEAMEYGLTGSIKEAEHRGYKDNLTRYIKHQYHDGETIVKLYNNEGNLIGRDSEKYQYSFIEKSRIDDFVRYKNRGAGDSIRNLFGLGGFNRFINEFNNEIDGKLTKIEENDIRILGKLSELKDTSGKNKEKLKELFEKIEKLFQENQLNEYGNNIEERESFIEKLKKEEVRKRDELIEQNAVQKQNNEELQKQNRFKRILDILFMVVALTLLIIGIAINYRFLLGILLGIIPLFIKKEQIKTVDEDSVTTLNDKIQNIETIYSKITIYKEKYKDSCVFDKEYQKFVEENDDNIKKAELNKERQVKLSEYETSYKRFYQKIHNYKNEISKGIIKESIEKEVVEIFNMLIANRKNGIKLEHITIPIIEGDKLLVKDVNGNEIDAFKVFSEGNLRALGISILLAKIILSNVSFIIGDDIVNALDEDFRKELCDLFVSDKFNNIQIILSSHSENFIRYFVGKINPNNYTQYTLLPNNSTSISKIMEKIDLISQIKANLDKGNKNIGISLCRKSLEKTLDNLSREVVIGTTSISCYSNFHPNTGQKFDALKKYVKDNLEQKELLKKLEEIEPGSHFYKYLNEESHEIGNKILEEINPTEAQKIFEIVSDLKKYKNLLQ